MSVKMYANDNLDSNARQNSIYSSNKTIIAIKILRNKPNNVLSKLSSHNKGHNKFD